jgi:hypothetical protein
VPLPGIRRQLIIVIENGNDIGRRESREVMGLDQPTDTRAAQICTPRTKNVVKIDRQHVPRPLSVKPNDPELHGRAVECAAIQAMQSSPSPH